MDKPTDSDRLEEAIVRSRALRAETRARVAGARQYLDDMRDGVVAYGKGAMAPPTIRELRGDDNPPIDPDFA